MRPLTKQQARMVAMVLYGKELSGGHAVIGLVSRASPGYCVGYTSTVTGRAVTTGKSAADFVSAFMVAAGDDPAALADTFTAIEAVQHPERGVECPECGADPGEQCTRNTRSRFGGIGKMERAHPARHAAHRAKP